MWDRPHFVGWIYPAVPEPISWRQGCPCLRAHAENGCSLEQHAPCQGASQAQIPILLHSLYRASVFPSHISTGHQSPQNELQQAPHLSEITFFGREPHRLVWPECFPRTVEGRILNVNSMGLPEERNLSSEPLPVITNFLILLRFPLYPQTLANGLITIFEKSMLDIHIYLLLVF